MSDDKIMPFETAQVGDLVVPLYAAQARVTAIEPYLGKFTDYFTHTVSYVYIGNGTKSCIAVKREVKP